MIKGIIFDLDGTLIKLPVRYELLLNNLRKFFDTTDEFKPLIPSIVKKSQGDENKLKNAFNLICEEELIVAENFELMENATQILDYFKSKNYTLGLVTMQCRNAAEKILSDIKISEFFYERMTKGGIMIFDDYGFQGYELAAKKAVDDFFIGKPEIPITLRNGQCLVLKI